MSLNFFIDQCVPNEIIEALREQGHHVTRVRDVMPGNSEDQKVIARSCEAGCILVSLN